MRCRAATDGFPYEHFHECTRRYDHGLHDEPDNDVHVCSCGARWRPHRLDARAPHWRVAAYTAARRWAEEHGHQAPDDRMLDIAYDAGYRQGLRGALPITGGEEKE